MIFFGLALLGLMIGIWTAKKRGGNRKDLAQYGAGYFMAFGILGAILTVIIDRMASGG